MSRKAYLAVFMLVISFTSAFAEVGESAGNEILNSNRGARVMGVGGASSCLLDSLSAIQTNPAGLSYLTNPEFFTSYNQSLFKSQYAILGFAKPVTIFPAAFACSIATLQDEDITLNFTNSDGSFKETKTVKAGIDYLAVLSYSQLLGEAVSVGINAKLLQSALAEQYKATAYAGDIGLLIRPIGSRINFGLAARNFGTGLKYISIEDPLQQEYVGGVSIFLLNTNARKFSIMCDYVKNEESKTNLGFECLWRNGFALRGGYRFGYDLDTFTVGFGLNVKGIGVDYAFVNRGDFESSQIVSMQMKFGNVSSYSPGESYFKREMFKNAINEWSKVSEGDTDYKKSQEGINEARQNIAAEKFEKKEKRFYKAEAKKDINEVEYMVSKASSQGIIILDSDKKIAVMKTLFKKGNYKLAKEKADDIKNSVRESTNKKLKDIEGIPDKDTVKTTGKNMAVSNFEARSPLSASEAAFITDFFRTAVVELGIFDIVDRNNMDKILAEQGFQQTGCTTEDCAVQMGKLLNVHYITIGSCGKLLSRFILTVNVVSVESGKIIFSANEDCYSESDIEKMTGRIAEKIKQKFK